MCTCSNQEPPSGNNNAYVCKYGTDETMGVCCYADIGVVSICKCGVRTTDTCSGFTPVDAYSVPSCPSGID